MILSLPDTAQIRQEIDIAFDDSALSAFSFDYLPEVYDRFSQGMRKDDKITALLDYCRRQPTGFEKLLENVRKKYEMSHFHSEQLKPLIDALELYIELSRQIADTTKGGVGSTKRPANAAHMPAMLRTPATEILPQRPQQRRDIGGRTALSRRDTSTNEGTSKPAWLIQAAITVTALFFGVLIGGYMMSGGNEPTADPPIISEKDGMTLLHVPEGDFEMGSADNDPHAYDHEKPRHTVFLKAYWIDQTEITNAMFTSFLNEMGNQEEGNMTWLDSEDEHVLIEQVNGTFQPKDGYANHPVIEVSWYAANAYCQWAGRRLPTEAEWEKAAGGTDGRGWPWGNEWTMENLANICDRNCEWAHKNDFIDDGYSRTSPVGNYPAGASPYGALDMAGNVWEWVADTFDSSYYASSPKENPQGPTSFGTKVIRGGSWYFAVGSPRVRLRDGFNALSHDTGGGFRCAK